MTCLRWLTWLLLVLACICMTGCAASRTELSGTYQGPTEKNTSAEKVSVFFLFSHLTQQHGYDSIPKLQSVGVKDFDNLFRDALGEVSNISTYETFTESPYDVNDPTRRERRQQLQDNHDFTLKISFFEESSFKQQCFSSTISLLSLTIIPMPYTWEYTVTAEVLDSQGNTRHSYQRKAELDNWVQVFLMFAYPFHPIEGKREDIYKEALHDILRQIETERVLKSSSSHR